MSRPVRRRARRDGHRQPARAMDPPEPAKSLPAGTLEESRLVDALAELDEDVGARHARRGDGRTAARSGRRMRGDAVWREISGRTPGRDATQEEQRQCHEGEQSVRETSIYCGHGEYLQCRQRGRGPLADAERASYGMSIRLASRYKTNRITSEARPVLNSARYVSRL